MYRFHFPDLKNVFNIKADRACYSRLLAVAEQHCLMISVVLLMLLVAGQAQGAAELCSRYQMPEFRSLCGRFPAGQVTVHDSVPGNDLNSLRDGWSSTPGLHILPPGTYPLNHAVELDANQAILPHPNTSLPENQALRTIILTADSDFSVSNEHMYLLKLVPDSAAGGIEIHSSQIAGSLASTGTKSLLWIESGGKVELLGSYLTSSSSGHPLGQLVYIVASQETDNRSGGEVHLGRNLLKSAGSYYGLVAHLQTGQKLSVNNTLVRHSHQGGAGVGIFKGSGRVTNSDVVIEGRCSSGGCTGVSFNQTEHHSVSRSTFWSTLSNPWVAQGISLNNLNPPDLIIDKGSTGWLGTNLFSPRMSIIAGVNESDENTLTDKQFRSEYLNNEYPMDAVEFFNYTGELGVTSLSSQAVQGFCPDSNSTGGIIDPLTFQTDARFSNSSFDLYYPPDRPQLSCVAQTCIDASQAVSYLIAAELVAGIILLITVDALCYARGRSLRPAVPYQGMATDVPLEPL